MKLTETEIECLVNQMETIARAVDNQKENPEGDYVYFAKEDAINCINGCFNKDENQNQQEK